MMVRAYDKKCYKAKRGVHIGILSSGAGREREEGTGTIHGKINAMNKNDGAEIPVEKPQILVKVSINTFTHAENMAKWGITENE